MRKSLFAIALTGLIGVSLLSGCKNKGVSKEIVEEQNIVADKQAEALLDEYQQYNQQHMTELDIDVQKYLDTMNKLFPSEGNICYSPVSLNTALENYTYLIKDGEPKDEIINFIGGIKYKDYIKAVNNYQENCHYRIIDRIWANTQYDLIFKDSPAKNFVYYIDMSKKSSQDIHNEFVDKYTNHFMTQTPEFQKSSTIEVMNIIYFQDKWLNDDVKMESYPFHNEDDTVTETSMMKHNLGSCEYYKNDTCYAIPIKYLNTMSTLYLIYSEDDIETVDVSNLFDGHHKKSASSIEVVFPEFEIDSRIDFDNEKLEKVGLAHIDECIPEYNSYNKDVQITQEVKIQVNKEGTKAGAMSTIIPDLGFLLGEDTEKLYFVFDKPFYYMVSDINNDISFIGRLSNINQ